MKCSKCGKDINDLNHHFIPSWKGKKGLRFCISCAREEKVVTLV